MVIEREYAANTFTAISAQIDEDLQKRNKRALQIKLLTYTYVSGEIIARYQITLED